MSEVRGVQFTVYGEARPAGSKRAFFKAGMKRAIVIEDDRKSAGWRENVAREAAKAMNGDPLLAGPLSLQVTFYRVRPVSHLKKSGGLTSSAPTYPETRPDTTKLIRSLEDALTGIVWRDDAQVCEQYARKEFGEPARVEVHVCGVRERAARYDMAQEGSR